jgi:hypothetical protein
MPKDTRTEYEKWMQYEAEKKKLQDRVLTPREYEEEIRKICDRLQV